MKLNIRVIYLYLFSFVGLVTVVIGSVRMVDLGLKVFIFKDADRYEYAAPVIAPDGTEKGIYDEQAARMNALREQKRNREREFSNAFAMIAVGLPLYLYHWRTIKKEHTQNRLLRR